MNTTQADRRERQALDEGLEQLRHGWTPAEVVCVLMDAWLTIQDLRTPICDGCGETFTGAPVQDPVAVSWIPGGAARFCSLGCLEADDERRINAAGNAS